MKKFKVFISTYPFGSVSEDPLDILRANDIEFDINPYKRKITYDELLEHLPKYDALIAGTETIDKDILESCPNLKIIARVGIGLDGIDFDEVQKRKIAITYTPDAVTQAVAELTVGNMINLARSIPQTHLHMKNGEWKRIIGFEIQGKTIGLIGFGRVGQRVAKILQGFSCKILVNDISVDEEVTAKYNVQISEKEEIYKSSDIISLHVPKTPITDNLIDEDVFSQMKKNCCLINTSRGGVVNESDLYYALKNKVIAASAIDVFEIEPYISGLLCQLDNLILTAHSGSCSEEARYQMEYGSALEIVSYAKGQPLKCPVPEQVVKVERAHSIVPVNSDWHEVYNSNSDEKSQAYVDYRKKWSLYPTSYYASDYPLNLDLELVYTQQDSESYSIDSLLKKPDETSKFIEMDLIEKVFDEIKKCDSPMAVKLGFRGDVLYHPNLFEIIKICKKAGVVETLITTSPESLNAENIQQLVDSELDVLSISIRPAMFPEQDLFSRSETSYLCNLLNLIRQMRAIKGSSLPQIRLIACKDKLEGKSLQSLKKFWSNWADIISIYDGETCNSNFKTLPNINWACSRLWQRLTLTYEGNFILCNHDHLEKCKLGSFPEQSIREVWQNHVIQSVRKKHKDNEAYQVTPCETCRFRQAELSKIH